MDHKKLSIIIPTLNEEKFLPNLLETLSNQTFQDFEVIVADSNSNDKTIELAKNFGAQITKGGLPGIGRNNGAKIAKGEIIAFIDADVTFPYNFLAESLEQFEKKKLDVAVCKHDTDEEKKIIKYIKRMWDSGKVIRQWTKVPIGSTEFMLVKRKVFEDLNGFNQAIKLQEDTEFIQRAVKNKYKFRVLNTKMRSSPRRLEKVGIVAVMIAGLLGTVYIGKNSRFFKKSMQDKLEKIYGGWGYDEPPTSSQQSSND